VSLLGSKFIPGKFAHTHYCHVGHHLSYCGLRSVPLFDLHGVVLARHQPAFVVVAIGVVTKKVMDTQFVLFAVSIAVKSFCPAAPCLFLHRLVEK
jgi:hypothetical protein